MTLIQSFYDKFWDPNIWLPYNITWEDLQSNDEIEYTNLKDIFYSIPMAVLVLVIRFCFEKYCFIPIGLALGIKGSKQKRVVPNNILEKAYKRNVNMKQEDIVGLAKQLDLTERQVERWLRVRRTQDKPSTLTKFTESGWRFTYYTFSFSLGLYMLWDKPWLWNTDLCWQNYPHQGVPNGIWWFYNTSASFYWSLIASQFHDIKRKDFWQMFAHHIITLFLFTLSLVCNFHRIGSLIILLHDFADIFLELAKMSKYAKYQKLCDSVFFLFIVAWLTTRIGVFPLVIIYSTAVRGPIVGNAPLFPAYYIFNGLLCLLLGLHLYWTYLILKAAKSALSAGKAERDIRSSSSDFSDNSDDSAVLLKWEHNTTLSSKNFKENNKK